MSKHLRIQSNLSLLGASFVWGFAFVAQRQGMQYIGPLTFNGIRFLLGAFSLIPVFWFLKPTLSSGEIWKPLLISSLIAGPVLMIASTFQQLGMMYTSAGNAGFITSLYIIFVPVFGFLRRQPSSLSVWLGASIAFVGLYLLSVDSDFRMQTGDLLVFISAIFWAMHLIVLSYLSPRFDFRILAFGQFLFTGIISLVFSLFFEQPLLSSVHDALYPILYAGIVSAGLGFTLQVLGQKNARADHAALILSLEAVVAAFGGWLILNEQLSGREIAGCILMLLGVLASQSKLMLESWKKVRL
jgi:drug/metabolite transporter (DMT)-like permease